MIHLEKAKIGRAVQILTGDVVKIRIPFVALMTQAVAVDLDAKWLLFEKGATVRGGFNAVDLEQTFADATVVHTIKKLSTLTLKGVMAHKFRAYRMGDGKKKPRRVMLSFFVDFVANPFPTIEHLMKCGRGDGEVTINFPEQKILPGTGLVEPNENGVFVDVKPVARFKCNDKSFKCNDKGFKADFTVCESEAGFHCGWYAQAGKQNTAMALEAARIYPTETDAIQTAAKGIYDLAFQVNEKGARQHRPLARLMMDWASAYINPQGTLA